MVGDLFSPLFLFNILHLLFFLLCPLLSPPSTCISVSPSKSLGIIIYPPHIPHFWVLVLSHPHSIPLSSFSPLLLLLILLLLFFFLLLFLLLSFSSTRVPVFPCLKARSFLNRKSQLQHSKHTNFTKSKGSQNSESVTMIVVNTARSTRRQSSTLQTK